LAAYKTVQKQVNTTMFLNSSTKKINV
jgi:hypothetical protein